LADPNAFLSWFPLRLNQIKLAGFKSFVDPTHLNVPGDLVGVVGPNGCGKSNIIDAVRWVLGESRASALRGDSMQDVIFNGSTLRKPVARASVELIFDNSLGRAAGQWSQYAEISVKRVLTRDGDSSYLINNTQVRRKDIHDIFLGTGLGPRAYAIIEQGMISRIIEAKPEELRVFLEEAAGVSKYKDRRRETENRLADTRENLARVGDIREELAGQIEKLDRQAQVAREFNDLSSQRQHKQHVLWILKRQESEFDAQRFLREIDKSGNQLEQVTANLREIERQLESAREDHYAAGDALTDAQGELFSANSEVARLESEIRHISDLRQRLQAELGQYSAQVEINERRSEELTEAEQLWTRRLEEMRARGESARELADSESARLPGIEEAFRAAQDVVSSARDRLTSIEHAHRLELTHKAHAEKVIQGLRARDERLSEEQSRLGVVDDSAINAAEHEVDALQFSEVENRRQLAELDTACAELSSQAQSINDALKSDELELSATAARLGVLEGLQRRVDAGGNAQDWLGEHGLASNLRLWQGIRVESGWEAAVESVLRGRLHAVHVGDQEELQRLAAQLPSSALALFCDGMPHELSRLHGLRPLADLVTILDPAVTSSFLGWMQGCYAMDGIPSVETRAQLPAQVLLVNRSGQQFTSCSVASFAADAPDSGILARQREIETLQGSVAGQKERVDGIQIELENLRRMLSERQDELVAMRATSASVSRNLHAQQVQLLKLSQERERFQSRLRQIGSERAEIQLGIQSEQDSMTALDATLAGLLDEMGLGRDVLERARESYREAEEVLEEQRRRISSAQRDAQDAGYAEKECLAKIDEVRRSLAEVGEQLINARERVGKISAELAQLGDADLKDQLQAILAVRVQREERLAECRAKQEQAASQLRTNDEARLREDQKLGPLRDGIAELRLKEQASRMSVQQFSDFLAEAGIDEVAVEQLSASIPEKQRPGPIQAEISRLTSEISALGAINMAALDELATCTERKSFLDSQAEDLAAALDTLENAIKRIDRETRELMQQTFDAVNEQFGKLFPMLFGGGEARLVMTGEEILDAGVQVVARPPGKKNSTIHLLSGGEKAMTAISLVFSFFQLNPAPFCLLDEVDAPLDDANTGRFCELVKKMSQSTQFLYISHNKLTMEMASHLVGVTMQEQGVSRVVAVDIDEALQLREPVAA
jgi:chromosome segregation protein